MMSNLKEFKPFMSSNYEQTKNDFNKNIKSLGENLEKIIKLVQDKNGISDLKKFEETFGFFKSALEGYDKVVKETQDILENKKAQQNKLDRIKNELKNLKIQKAKRDSFDVQKRKQKALELLNSLKNELNKIDSNIEAIDAKLKKLKATKNRILK